METTENNKLIVEFMGGKVVKFQNYMAADFNKNIPNLLLTPISQMRYNTSWDELMPVVEKCLETHNSLIDGREIIDTPYHYVVSAMQEVRINELHKAVVEFIKWYNENK